MKHFIITLSALLICSALSAQVPFFGTSPGKNNIYSYTQLEFKPGVSSQSLFIFSHYGITDRFSAGIEIIGGGTSLLQGFNLKYQFVAQKYLNLSIQTSARMNLNNSYRFDHQNISLFLNGMITKDLGYITNTYLNVYSDGTLSSYQYWYLSYQIKRVIIFLGETNNWTGKINPDLTIGLGVNLGRVNLYAWSGNYFHNPVRFTIGFDYSFSCKK